MVCSRAMFQFGYSELKAGTGGRLTNSMRFMLAMAVWALSAASPCAGQEDSEALRQAALTARLAGNFAQAGDLYTTAIRDLEAAGGSNVRLARLLVELGSVREAQGNCQQAVTLVTRGIRILEAANDRDFQGESDAWLALSKAEGCERQYSKAGEALQRAFDIEQSGPAPRKDELVEIVVAQGVLQVSERRFAEAEKAFKQAQAITNQDSPPDAMAAVLVLNNLGAVYRAMGRGAESGSCFPPRLGNLGERS